jgi:hypothetical protein
MDLNHNPPTDAKIEFPRLTTATCAQLRHPCRNQIFKPPPGSL